MKKKHLLSFLALSFFMLLASGSFNSTPSDPATPDTSMAKVMCDDFMKKSLKAPSTAVFAGPLDGIQAKALSYEKGVHTYELASYVDAQNSFGAQMRTKFYCKTSNTSGSNSWTLVDLQTL